MKKAAIARLKDYLAARLSESSTVRSLLRLAGAATGAIPDDPERGVYLAAMALVIAEVVGFLFPDKVKRGKKLINPAEKNGGNRVD